MRVWNITAAALLVFAVGCNKSTEGGTPQTKSSFKLSLPTAKDVKQGNTETFEGSVDRGSDLKKDVNLKVDAPAKLDVKLNKGSIKAGDGDTKFSITVTPAKDAPIGDHSIKVTGTTDGGEPAIGTFTVKVTENK